MTRVLKQVLMYLTIVRPLLEYTSCVWPGHQIQLFQDIEKSKVCCKMGPIRLSVTEMVKLPKWPTLETRIHLSRLSQFHKIVHQLTTTIQIPPYYLLTQYPTRHLYI